MRKFLCSSTVFVLLLAVTTACSIKSEEFKYDYTENGCATGSHQFSSKGDYCAALKNDSLNNGCAKGSRRETYKAQCGPDFDPAKLTETTETTFDQPADL